MPHGHERVTKHHARSRESHDLGDPLLHLLAVAVHRAFPASGLAVAERAGSQPAVGILEQLAARLAEFVASVMRLAVEANHRIYSFPLLLQSHQVHQAKTKNQTSIMIRITPR